MNNKNIQDKNEVENNIRKIMAKKGIDKKCTSQGKIFLYKMAQLAFEARSIFYNGTIKQLSEMMYGGHKMFSSGGTPKDGDQSSASVIWGHIQMCKDVGPQIPVNFIISHFLARFFSFALKDFKIIREKEVLFY